MNILVVAAHPDDEILGCGATLAKHVQRGDRVDILVLAEGLTSRDDRRDVFKRKKDLRRLADAAQKAGRLLGVRSVQLHDFPDNRMDSVTRLDVVKVIEKAVERVRPQIVYTHHGGDVNIDHQIAFQAVSTACRPQPGRPVSTLLCFETSSSTEWQLAPSKAFIPNWFVDVTRTLPRKMKALKINASEMRPWPHARSYQAIESLARWRGASVGVAAAEAFMLGRNVVR